VKGCTECQRHKVNNRPTKAALEPIWAKPEATPFETVAIDFITKLPVSQGYDSILTVTDHNCSKATIFIPCVEEISGEETAALYAKHVFARYGLPTKIISDCDPRFTSKFTCKLCKLLGIQQNISTAYHPHMDGQSERSNQWLEQYLRFWVNEQQDDWAKYLPLAEFAHNNWTNESMCESPFHTLIGYHPRADYSGTPSTIPHVTTRLEQYNEAQRKAQELMQQAQQSWVRHCDTTKYKEGDQVWLEGRHLCTNQPTAKLTPKRHGPFKVIQVMSPVNYRLELPTQWSIHDVFHTDLLTPYCETPMHGANYLRPPPDLVDGVEEYEVEKVLDSRRHGRGHKLQYLIKWIGYPDSDNQWVNWDDATGAEDAIQEFKRINSDREIHIKASHTRTYSPSASRSSLMSTSSYHDATICYANNNNVDDAATYNDHLRGCRSPGINSDVLSKTATIRDMEDTEADILTLTADGDMDAASRPPILEDGSGHLGGQLSVSSLRATGEETSIAGKSAGNTPYPNTAILFDESKDEDLDIQCGRCENPIAYCHCDNSDILIIPPPIVTTITTVVTTQDGEETTLPTAKEEEDNSPLVEVRVGRGLCSPTDARRGIQDHRRRMYTPGTPQCQTHRTLSPTPDGFICNQGLNYVPFCIPTTDG
jgi:hypothetical protein